MNTRKIQLKLVVILIVQHFFSFAQSDVSIKGRVLTNSSKGLPYVNIIAINNVTSEIIDGVITNEEGFFDLNIEYEGIIKLKVYTLGYKEHISDSFDLREHKIINLDTIILETDEIQMDEVILKSKKPKISIKSDKIIVNVKESVLSNGSSSLDILERSPGVYVGGDGDIRIKGRAGVIVMINNKRTSMGGTELKQYLKSLAANNIKNIEIIDNPSAKYDAEGIAGIINITLVKSKTEGSNGSVEIGSSYNGIINSNFSGNYNRKFKKWDIGTLINYNDSGYGIDLDLDRNFTLLDRSILFDQESYNEIKEIGYLGNLLIDYNINDNNLIGGNFQYQRSENEDFLESTTEVTDSSINEIQNINSINDGDGPNERVSFNLHYIGTLDTLGTKISADIDMISSKNKFNSLLKSDAINDSDVDIVRSDFISTEYDFDNIIVTEQIDFTKIFKNESYFETGLKGSQITSENESIIRISDNGNDFVLDTDESIFFDYQENIYAGYLNYNNSFKSINFSLGLRGEYTDLDFESSLNRIENSYLDFFPSASLSYTAKNENQYSFSYNRRINRPSYSTLSPSISYIDPFTIEKGNPGLQPMYSSNFETSYTIKNKYQVSFSYSRTKDYITTVLLQSEEDFETVIQVENLDKAQEFGLNFIVSTSLFNWWNINYTLGLTQNYFDSVLNNNRLDSEQFSYFLQTQNSFDLPKGYKMELFGAFFGPQNVGQFVIDDFFWFDFGVSKSIFDDKLNISLKGSDIFRSRKIKSEINFGSLASNVNQYNNNQSISLSLRFNFVSGKDFSIEKRSGSDSEKERLD